MSLRHDDYKMDWRASRPGHKAAARRLPKEFRKALRKYRKEVIPMAGGDDCSWWSLAVVAVVVVVVVWLAIAGMLP